MKHRASLPSVIWIVAAVTAVGLMLTATPTQAKDFHQLCKTGTAQQVEKAIQAGADVNAKGQRGNTPLMVAAANNNSDVIKILLKAGAKVNVKDKRGRTPLIEAADCNKNPEVIKILLKAGADPKARDKSGWTPLIWAAADNNNPDVIKILLKAGAKVNADVVPNALLMVAVTYNNNPEVIKAVIKTGADVNVKGGERNTPLMQAAAYNNNSGDGKGVRVRRRKPEEGSE